VKESTSSNPVKFFWNLYYNDYQTDPTEVDNVGDYELVLRSCVAVSDTNVCVLSTPWIVNIYDPCTTTTIGAYGWNRILQAPLLGTNQLDFAAQIILEGGVFPWTTSLDDITEDSIGTDLCGNIIYTITAKSYTESLNQPLIMQSGTSITLQPSFEFTTGLYELTLTGRLQLYPSVFKSVDFTV